MIRLLDDLTINKIAAGEVVEGPFSVVKELVENAIDAQASSIVLEIKEGGKKLIRITDDGVGIPEQEVETAFLRHATSKITGLEDLEQIYSLGFRGEALASISSIAQVEIITRPKEQPYGVSLELHGGKLIHKKQVGCPAGTTIMVKNMFFNTPARYKFMKSTSGETTKISEIITRLSLSKPNITFKYINNNNIMFTTPGNGDLSQTIMSVFERELFRNLIRIETEGEYQLEGYISQPTFVRGNRSYEIVFINGRYVKSKLVFQAIESAYRERLPINKFPICILNIQLDPSVVDVNVHPTKTEVKFHHEVELQRYIQQAIEKALTAGMTIPKLGLQHVSPSIGVKKPEGNNSLDRVAEDRVFEERKSEDRITEGIIKVDKIKEDVIKEDNIIDVPAKKDKPTEAVVLEEKPSYERPVPYTPKEAQPREKMLQSAFQTLVKEQQLSSRIIEEQEEMKLQEEVKQHNFLSSLLLDTKIIGQLFQTYIILEKDQAMYLIDQHAAHERLVYNRLKREFEEAKVVTQRLVAPEVITLAPEDYEIILEHLPKFTPLGFEIEDFGQNTIIVRGVPIVLGIPRNYQFLLDTIDELKSGYDKGQVFHEKLIQKACKEAIKGLDWLSQQEVVALLEELSHLEPPLTCPHGRPIVLTLTKYEIEKHFKRIQ